MKTLLFFFLGACIGSFLGVVIDRFPHQSLLFPASHCNHCHKRLGLRDLIPIVSQLMTASHCRHCKAHIPYWYGVFEFLTGFLLVLTEWRILSIAQCLLLMCGLTLTVYDIKHRAYPVMVWLFFAGVTLPFSGISIWFLGFVGLAILAHFFQLKIGAGDFLYLASLSLLLPFYDLLWLIQLSSLFGIAVFLYWKPKNALPFIPFLLVAYLVLICIKGA